MAVLGLLCLEMLRELALYVLNSPTDVFNFTEAGPFAPKYHGNSEYRISDSGSGVGALFFLFIYVGLMIGLWRRSPLALLMGLILLGGAGVVNLLFLWPAFLNLLKGTDPSMVTNAVPVPQRNAWTYAKIALQLSVPALLGLAWLRGRLRWD